MRHIQRREAIAGDDVRIGALLQEKLGECLAFRGIELVDALDVFDLHPHRPMERRALEELPLIDPFVDRSGVFP